MARRWLRAWMAVARRGCQAGRVWLVRAEGGAVSSAFILVLCGDLHDHDTGTKVGRFPRHACFFDKVDDATLVFARQQIFIGGKHITVAALLLWT
jgi:hypothetical protein